MNFENNHDLVNHIVRTLTFDVIWLIVMLISVPVITYVYPVALVENNESATYNLSLIAFTPIAILSMLLAHKAVSLSSWRRIRKATFGI